MTTGTLAAIILGIVSIQVGLAASLAVFRRRSRLAEAGTVPYRPPEAAGPAPGATAIGAPSAAAWEGYREFRIERRVYENADKSICSFYLVPGDAGPLPPFKPGQYLTFKLASQAVRGYGSGHLVRCYSLSDRPGEERYRISVKRVPAPAARPEAPPGLVSNYFHERLQAGDRLMVKAPAGHFHLIEDSTLPVVLIAGGVGITPMMSMLNTLLDSGGTREIWLFYGVRDGRELILGEHLRAFARSHENFHLHLCFSRPKEREVEGIDFQHQGRIDIPLLRNTLKLGRYQFYICGPAGMMESLVAGLQRVGVEGGDIHHESFGPSAPAPARKAATGDRDAQDVAPIVTFRKSGKQVAWSRDAGSILALAEGHDIEVESGCRAGCCGSCETRIERGEVDYSQIPEADIEPGHCLLCIASPRGDLVLPI